MFKKLLLSCLPLLLFSCGSLPDNLKAPKREFRGFWIATVANIDWPASANDPILKKKNDFITLLDFYKSLNFNAAIVQIRTAGDAFYPSAFAPWSRFLTGKEGEASIEYNDLLHWMINETHKRGMEFHAWINPYRATLDLNTEILSETHDYVKHPEWMVKYGKKYYYNPGLPEVQQHLKTIIGEIVNEYEIDAIHFDDYFYPYTIKEEFFNDDVSYKMYAKEVTSVENWRRNNIDSLIKSTFDTIKSVKPWVAFGVSPFGVWRNRAKDPKGSDTRAGQTTFDDLYADVLTWTKKGWIDYLAPQLYWSLDYPPASHRKLMEWWTNNKKETHLYIGNGPFKIRNNADKAWNKKKELPNQLKLARINNKVSGNIFFSAKSLKDTNADIVKYLKKKYYAYPAITASLKEKERYNPHTPLRIKTITLQNETYVFTLESFPENGKQFIMYGFDSKTRIDLNSGKCILKMGYPDNVYSITLNKKEIKRKKVFALSYLDRFNNESTPVLFTINKAENGNFFIAKVSGQ